MLKMSLNEIRGQIQIYPENWVNVSTTNCYAYALGLDIRESDICEYAYQPGVISNQKYKIHRQEELDYEKLIENIEEDFKILNLEFCEVDLSYKTKTNEWKIILCTENKYEEEKIIGFHFIRSNNNEWSNKPNYNETINKISKKAFKTIKNNELLGYTYKKCYLLNKKIY